MYKRKDLTGLIFGTIKVLEFSHVDKYRYSYWKCICLKCGLIKVKNTRMLKEVRCSRCSKIKHGQSRTRLWRIYDGIKKRCFDRNNKFFKDYGGKGITLCDEWMNFDNFKIWALQNGYDEKLTIDRIDNNGNYEPSNCRWADGRTQANNKSNNFNITIDNTTHTLTEWARIYWINRGTIRRRIEMGWSVEDAIKTKVGKRFCKTVEKYSINGISKSLYDWCEVYKIDKETARRRMKCGMSLIEALGVKKTEKMTAGGA